MATGPSATPHSTKGRIALLCAFSTCLVVAAVGCGAEDDGGQEGPRRLFADAPELPDGAMEMLFPETLVEAATEKQTCYFLEPLEEDVYVTALESYQTPGGHHLVLFKSIVPEPAGSVRDCTQIIDMVTLIPVVSSVNFGLEDFPAGMAVRVSEGTQLVLQQHYLNTRDEDVLVNDVAHLQTVAVDDVEVFAGFYGLAEIDFVLPPDSTDRTVAFECEVPLDISVLLVGPHMHEWGVRFKAEGGSRDALQSLIDIPRWDPVMRDEPPAVQFTPETALQLQAGDVIRTECTFNNTSGHDLEFPSEMCATYGYYFPAPNGSEEWLCDGPGNGST